MAGKNQPTHHNIFIINSGFQLFSSILIANSQPEKRNIFICIEPFFLKALEEYGLGRFSFHLNIKKTKNSLLKKIRIKEYLKQMFSIIEADEKPEKISFFVAVIDGARYNYPIEKAKSIYGRNNVSINIIPDGACNTKTIPLSKKKSEKIRKKENSLFDKILGIKYTPFHNDNHGILSDTVNNIYVIPEMPNEYPANKTTPLPKTIPPTLSSNKNNKKKSTYSWPIHGC